MKKLIPNLAISILALVSVFVPTSVTAATTTYDFNSDTLGSAPAGSSVLTGTFAVTNQATIGNSLRATATGAGNTASILLTNFATSTDQTFTWKEINTATSAYDGFILRAQSALSGLGTGIRQGYLFQVRYESGSLTRMRIYVVGSGASLTQLSTMNVTTISTTTPRWFKAVLTGSSLGFYYSDNGTSYTLASATSTDSTFASGIVEYTAGYNGTSLGTSYVDDIIQETPSVIDTTAPVISAIASSTTNSTAAISWTTDEAADTRVDYGTTIGYGTASTSAALSTSHSISLSGLSPSTLYHYRVQSTDASTNTATSTDLTFTTAAAPDTTAPVISAIATSTSATTATVTWTTNENSNSTVNYGTTASYGSASTTATLSTSHSITLAGLSSSTLYHYQVQSTDASSNTATSTDLTFTTSAVVDTTPPVISSIASSTAATTATITWTTNESSDSRVDYGTTTGYGTASTSAATSTSHSITLTGLTASTLYHYRVQSTDASSNTATSTDKTFTTSAATGSITITTPKQYQVFQRNGSNLANISITGTYTGTPTAIEASWNGGAYTTIVASPTGGTFSGTLSNQTGGQGTLSVRFTDTPSIVATKTFVGVGDIYVMAGQSNFSGRGFNNQTYTSPPSGIKAVLFGNDDNWKELVDPFDAATGSVDNVSIDSAAGSLVPLLATYILADQSVPVAFIPTAKGGTAISSWLPDSNHKLATTLFGSMERRIDAAANGSVKAVLWFQGESDAQACTSYSTYTSSLNTIVDTIATDYPGTKTVVGQIGHGLYTVSCTDAIRRAQSDIPHNNANTLAGAITYDVNLADESGDTTHFKSDGDLSAFAQRWWNALSRVIYGNSIPGSPVLSSVTYNSTTNKVDLLFDSTLATSTAQSFTNNLSGATTLATSSAFALSTTGGTPTIASTTLLPDNKTLRLNLSGATATTLSVSYASGQTGVNNALYSTNGMSAIPFFTQTATAADVIAPVISSIASSTAATTATITWTTNEASDSTVNYGATSSYGTASTSAATSTSHSITLTGLSPSTLYHFQVQSADSSGNTATSTDRTFTTTAVPDTTAPVISSISSGTPGQTTATILWTTNESSNSTVNYGTTSGYGTASTSVATSTSHSITLIGLTPNTLYHYQVQSTDLSSNTATSSDQTFTTSAVPDTTAPVISAIAALPSTTTATVTWTTNEAADSCVDFATTTSYRTTQTSGTLVTSHTISLTGLTASTLYHYRVQSTDASSNTATSTDQTFTTTAEIVVEDSGGHSHSSRDSANERANERATEREAAERESVENTLKDLILQAQSLGIVISPDILAALGIEQSTVTFNRDLYLGIEGTDVQVLQKFLNKNGFTIALSGPGAHGQESFYFGELTKVALIRFQNAHAAEILIPTGLTSGTGYFGASTRAYVNTH